MNRRNLKAKMSSELGFYECCLALKAKFTIETGIFVVKGHVGAVHVRSCLLFSVPKVLCV